MSASLDENINYDEIEELISDQDKTDEINTESSIIIDSRESLDKRLVSQKQHCSSSCITQVQNISLSSVDKEKNSENDSCSNKSKISILNIKTSNIPGPVGLLPILVRLNFD
jgi:hypothetical protein